MKKALLILLVAVLLLVGCGKKEEEKPKDPIVGEWAYFSYVYKFNEDKTCSYYGRNCTYEINGDKLSILYEGDTAPFETTFKIEGNKLTIKDSLDKEVVYTKK